MIEGTTKRKPKKDMPFCHSLSNFVLKVVSIRWSIIIRHEKTSKAASRGQKKR